jgi:DNA-binding MarR family transcriptional regulator
LEGLAEEVFELSKLASRLRTAARREGIEALTETESLTLDLLNKNKLMSVGEIQKAIGVLPAQMSRIIRSLEDKPGQPYITCRINSEDRRKIDVTITEAGTEALSQYRLSRLSTTVSILAALAPSERDEFMRLLRKIRDEISKAFSDR